MSTCRCNQIGGRRQKRSSRKNMKGGLAEKTLQKILKDIDIITQKAQKQAAKGDNIYTEIRHWKELLALINKYEKELKLDNTVPAVKAKKFFKSYIQQINHNLKELEPKLKERNEFHQKMKETQKTAAEAEHLAQKIAKENEAVEQRKQKTENIKLLKQVKDDLATMHVFAQSQHPTPLGPMDAGIVDSLIEKIKVLEQKLKSHGGKKSKKHQKKRTKRNKNLKNLKKHRKTRR